MKKLLVGISTILLLFLLTSFTASAPFYVLAQGSDSDGDGIPDFDDDCPGQPGPESNFGCPYDPASDSDGDGITDELDHCPNESGPQWNEGCPEGTDPSDNEEVYDSDGDGVEDDFDFCPNDPGSASNNGCPDTDGDGFNDNVDACALDPEDYNGYKDDDGCPDGHLDDDGDGIRNDLDECVDSPENYNNYQDTDGCPETPPTPTNSPPVIQATSASTNVNTQVDIKITATDADGDTITFTVFDPPHGIISNSHSKTSTSITYVYKPDSNYAGTDSFKVTANDGKATVEKTITVTVVGTQPVDSDGDGVPDNEDACPNEIEDYLGAIDGCKEAGGLVNPPPMEFKITPESNFWTLSWDREYKIPIDVDLVSGGPGTVRLSMSLSPENGYLNSYLTNTAVSPPGQTTLIVNVGCEAPEGQYIITINGVYNHSPYNTERGGFAPAVVEENYDSASITIDVVSGLCAGDEPPFTDSDGDGIADSQDACPTQPEDNYTYDPIDGCPEEHEIPTYDEYMELAGQAFNDNNWSDLLEYCNNADRLKPANFEPNTCIAVAHSMLGNLQTALDYAKKAQPYATTSEERDYIQTLIDAINHDLGEQAPPPSTQFLDVTGTWKGTIEFSVWFDYYPAPVTCSYVGNIEMKLRQTGNSVTGSSFLVDVTKATTPTGCFSWHESYGYGAISGDLFGSALSGTFNSNQLTGRFTTDLFEGEFSQQGTVSVTGKFSLMREGAPTIPKSTMQTTAFDDLIQKANSAGENGNFQQVINYANQAIQIDPNRFEPYLFIAGSHYELGNYDKALEYAYKAYDRAPPEFREELKSGIEELESLQQDSIATDTDTIPGQSTRPSGNWKGKFYASGDTQGRVNYYTWDVDGTFNFKVLDDGSIDGSGISGVYSSIQWGLKDQYGNTYSCWTISNQAETINFDVKGDVSSGKVSLYLTNASPGEISHVYHCDVPDFHRDVTTTIDPFYFDKRITLDLKSGGYNTITTSGPYQAPGEIFWEFEITQEGELDSKFKSQPITTTPIPTPTPKPTPDPIQPVPTPTKPSPPTTPSTPKEGIDFIPLPSPKTPTTPTTTPTNPTTPTTPVTTTELSLFADRETYGLGNTITLKTQLSDVSGTHKVALTVSDSFDNVIVSRTVTTSEFFPGRIQFTVSPEMSSGDYKAIASAEINGQKYSHSTTFNVNTNVVEQIQIKSVQATDQQGNPISSFEKQRQGYVKVVLSSSLSKPALVTVNLFDSDLTSIGTGSIQSTIGQGESEIILSFFISDDATLGTADIYANVFTDWPSNGGTPLTGESSGQVDIR